MKEISLDEMIWKNVCLAVFLALPLVVSVTGGKYE